MKRVVLLALAIAVWLGTVAVLPGVGAVDAPTGDAPVFTAIQKCIADRNALDLEMVIDTSSSLKTTDPTRGGNAQRVVGAQAVIAGLRGLASRRSDADVRVKLSGFSDGYQPGAWTPVGSPSLDAEILAFNARSTGNTTRFGEGLRGAQQGAAATASSRCSVVVFFTDGALDMDNNPRDDGPENAARASICAGDGPVATMRRQGTKLITVSLMPNPATESFLEKMADGDCGTPPDPAAGTAISVASADTLIDEFDKVGQVQPPQPGVTECPADLPVPASVNAFHVFARAGVWNLLEVKRSEADRVQVPAPAVGAETTASGNGFQVRVKRPTQGTALIDVTGISGESSTWHVAFDEANKAKSTCRAYLFEAWKPVFSPEPHKFRRGLPTTVSARIVGSDGQSVSAEFASLKVWEPSLAFTLTSPVDGPDGKPATIEVPANRTGDRYTADVTVPNSWSTGVVTIQGTFVVSEAANGAAQVSALTDAPDVRVATPPGFPEFVGGHPVHLSKVSGTGRAEGVLRFKGSTMNAGTVEIDGVRVTSGPADSSTYNGREVGGSRTAIRVEQNATVDVPVAVDVTKSADGTAVGFADVHLTSLRADADVKDATLRVEFTFMTARKVCSACRLGLTVALLVGALLVPLALLWLLNLRGAKFEPPSELRAAAIPFAIEASGKARRDDGRVDDLPPDRYTYIDTPHDQQVRAFQVSPPGSAMPWEFVAKTSLNPFKPPSGLMRSHTIGAIGRSGMDGSLPPHGVVPLALRGAWVFRLDSIEELDAPADVAGEVAEEQPIALKGELLVFVSSEVPEREQLPKILTDAYAVLPDLGRALGASILEQRRAVAARTEAQTGPVPEASDDGPSGPHLLPPSDGPSYSSTMQPPADGGGSNPSWMTGPGPFDGDDPSGRLMPPP